MKLATIGITLLLGLLAGGCKKTPSVTAEDAGAGAAAAAAAPSLAEAPSGSAIATASARADASAPKPGFAVNDKIKVTWKGGTYPAVITSVVGVDRYKIHYDGYGKEWDEVLGPSRIVGRR